MKNTLLFDGITQLLAPQHFASVIGKLMNNPGLTAKRGFCLNTKRGCEAKSHTKSNAFRADSSGCLTSVPKEMLEIHLILAVFERNCGGKVQDLVALGRTVIGHEGSLTLILPEETSSEKHTAIASCIAAAGYHRQTVFLTLLADRRYFGR